MSNIISNNDLLERFVFENAPVRGEFIRLHESFQTIIQQHAYPLVIAKLLGEALCVGALLSAIIKFEGRLTVQFRGQGKLKLLLAQSDNQFNLRGLVKWSGEFESYEELLRSLAEGVLVITLDGGTAKNRYQGIVAWTGNSLAESIEGYFQHSEQLATKLWLSVNETTAAGLLLQIIPAATQNASTAGKEALNPDWERIIKATTMQLLPENLLEMDPQALLVKLYPNEEVRIFPSTPVKFTCTCSRKRGEEAINLIGQEEAEQELKDKQVIVVTCDFCGKEYVFDRVDVEEIFKKQIPPDTHLH